MKELTTQQVMEVITRKQAQEQGLTHYFTGKPCKNGHVAKRQTAKGVCQECHRLYQTGDKGHAAQRKRYAERMAADPAFAEQNRANAKKHYHQVMKHDEERMARHYERVAARHKENREICNRAQRAHRQRNPGYDRPYVVARRALIKHCDLTETQQQQVKAIYKLREVLTAQTGVEYHVDHRIPLAKGGQHHPDNLWVIPAVDNLRKGAKMPAEAAA